MRKMFFSAVIMLMGAFTATADDKKEVWDWPKYSYYADANAELLKNKPEDPRRVVFFGNSITEGWPIHSPQFFAENPNFVGRGVWGQSSYEFLLRFIEDVIKLKPAAVVICAGGNDVAENTCPYNEERTFNNIVGLIDMAQAHGIQVILTSVLPAAKFPWSPEITGSSDKIAALNVLLKNYADSHDIPYVDYYSSLVNGKPDRAFKEGLAGDGVHPNAEGYKIMEKLVLPVIKKYVP